MHGRSGIQGIVAGVEASAAHDTQLRDGVGELGQAHAGLALAGVEAYGLLAVGAGRVDGDAGWDDRSALVGEDVGGVVAHVSRGAVDVEDAASGRGSVVYENGEGFAGADVIGGQDEVVDGGREVVGCDVGHKAEVGRSGLGRVDRGGGSGCSAGHAHKGQNAGERQS